MQGIDKPGNSRERIKLRANFVQFLSSTSRLSSFANTVNDSRDDSRCESTT